MKNTSFPRIKKQLPRIKTGISLKNYTTFKIGGKAKYFFEAKTKQDLVLAIKKAKEFKLPFFVLGGGSNVLVSDRGFDGLVIKMRNEKLKIKNYNTKFKIICEAGIPLARLVSKSLQIGVTGLEWATRIPGTIGGAVRGNAGAFDGSMKDVVREVEVFDAQDLKFKIYKSKKCRFGYRDSIFKKNPELIIFSCGIYLKKGKKEEIEKKIKGFFDYKKGRHPWSFPSAGSIFKNSEKFSAGRLKERTSPSAGELIEKCGLKGKKIGRAQISKKHTNFIVNLGGAKAKDVKELINLIKKTAKRKYRVELEEEIQYLGP